MTRQEALAILGTAALVAVLVLASARIGYRKGIRTAQAAFKPSVDTFVVYKPIVARNAPIIAHRALPSIPTFVFFTDSTTQEIDSLAIALEFVQRVQKDSMDLYTAYVSGPMVGGYGPRLDSLQLNIPEKIINTTVVQEHKLRPRYSLGIQAGYGIPNVIANEVRPAPYIGIGIQFNLLSWDYR